MDITTAQSLLRQAIASKSSDIEALQLAASILDGTYQADLSSLKNSKAEADKLAADLSAEKNKTSDLTSQVETLTPLVQQVADLTSQNSDLTTQVDTLTTAVTTVTDAISGISTAISDAQDKVSEKLSPAQHEIPINN